MKLMRKGPDGNPVPVDPWNMTKDELERLGAMLNKAAESGKHVPGHDPKTCNKFAGVPCGEVGRELHEFREIWRDRAAAGWKTKDEIEAEKQTIRSGQGQYKCPDCPRAFSRRGNLLNHIDSEHSGKKALVPTPAQTAQTVQGYTCWTCKKGPFPDRDSLYEHRRQEHPGRAATTRRRVTTSERGKQFASKSGPKFGNVADGFYKLGSNTYKVDVPTSGRWANYRFVKIVNTDGTTTKQEYTEAMNILGKISEDPDKYRVTMKPVKLVRR